jgi:hypothetical protein
MKLSPDGVRHETEDVLELSAERLVQEPVEDGV